MEVNGVGVHCYVTTRGYDECAVISLCDRLWHLISALAQFGEPWIWAGISIKVIT